MKRRGRLVAWGAVGALMVTVQVYRTPAGADATAVPAAVSIADPIDGSNQVRVNGGAIFTLPAAAEEHFQVEYEIGSGDDTICLPQMSGDDKHCPALPGRRAVAITSITWTGPNPRFAPAGTIGSQLALSVDDADNEGTCFFPGQDDISPKRITSISARVGQTAHASYPEPLIASHRFDDPWCFVVGFLSDEQGGTIGHLTIVGHLIDWVPTGFYGF